MYEWGIKNVTDACIWITIADKSSQKNDKNNDSDFYLHSLITDTGRFKQLLKSHLFRIAFLTFC